MARARAGSGFLLFRPPPQKRYVLTCAKCGFAFEKDEETLGQAEQHHYMRFHDTTLTRMHERGEVVFVVLDRWKNETRELN